MNHDLLYAAHAKMSLIRRNAAIRCLTLVLIVVGSLHPALGSDVASLQKKLESCYRQMDRAATRLDVHGYMAFGAPDMVAVSDGKTFHDRSSFELLVCIQARIRGGTIAS